MIYTAKYVVTQNSTREVVEDGAVLVIGSDIAAVGKAQSIIAANPSEKIESLGEAVILPGLVNAHTHLPMSVFRGLGDDKPLMAWLNEDIFPREARLTVERETQGALLSMAELVRTGCTAFYDMYMREECVFAAADKIGLRGVLGESLTRYFPAINGGSIEEAEERIRANAAAWEGHPRLRGAVTPHAVYTTDASLLVRLRELADECGFLFGMHMSETQAEDESSMRDFGKRPIPYCDSLGILRSDTSLFHCVHLDDFDISILRDRGCIPVHNPASNLKLASGLSPVPRLVREGFCVGLGTDGAASNNCQNMVREMYLAALVGKFSSGEPHTMTSQMALDMATLGGAAALHDDGIGSIEIGKKADFIALDLNSPNMRPVNDIVSNAVYSATGFENRLTVVDGVELYKDGKFLTIDYDSLKQEISK